ncbi:unnamed protein product [Caenorhabditis sp. 36 PRJEB53466]|nr:unnamed protein product [Caenorhabditis sp. 36 PRJEB53466]
MSIFKNCRVPVTVKGGPCQFLKTVNFAKLCEQSFFGDLILTGTTGSIVRVVGKEVKQVIKRGSTDEMKDIEELIAKEAPIQKMEEFEDELMNQSEEEDIAKPPEKLAVAVRVEEGEDNTDVVDMEIDKVVEAAPTIPVVVPSTGEEEAGIPMDPMPSTPEASFIPPF